MAHARSAAPNPSGSWTSLDGVCHIDVVHNEGYSAREYYRGEVAANYTDHRVRSAAAALKWQRESDAAQVLLDDVPKGARVLDLPCGDGRFADALERLGVEWVGADISIDMMLAGRGRHASMERAQALIQSDGEALPFRDGTFDFVLCARFANLVPLPVLQSVLTELRRVTRSFLILEVRVERDTSWASPARRARRIASRLRARLTGQQDGVERSTIARDPLRVHHEAAFRSVVRDAGWVERQRVEVVTSRWPLRPDPLYFVRLDAS